MESRGRNKGGGVQKSKKNTTQNRVLRKENGGKQNTDEKISLVKQGENYQPGTNGYQDMCQPGRWGTEKPKNKASNEANVQDEEKWVQCVSVNGSVDFWVGGVQKNGGGPRKWNQANKPTELDGGKGKEVKEIGGEENVV